MVKTATSGGGRGGVRALSDSKLASEHARLVKEADRLAARQRDIAIDLRASGNDDRVREKWNAANEESRRVRQRAREIEDEMSRRRRAAEPARRPVSEETRKRNIERGKLANWRNILIEEQASRARKEARRTSKGQYRGKR